MKKISSSHSSYIENAEELIKFLRKNILVSKISLGIIKPKKSASKTVTKPKISVLPTHILIRINSKLYNQELRVYGQNLETLEKDLNKFLR